MTTALLSPHVLVRLEGLVALAAALLAHLGVDRLLGYGLKDPTAFKDTHLQRL